MTAHTPALLSVDEVPGLPTTTTTGFDVPTAGQRKASDGLDAKVSMWLLRAGLAFVFVYAAVMGLVRPDTVAKYVPSVVPPWAVEQILLPVFALYELALAICLFTRRYVRLAAFLSVVTLAGINVANLDAFGVLFRNVAIACAAAALCIEARDHPEPSVQVDVTEPPVP